MDEYTDEAVDALEQTMRDELRALLLVEDGDAAVAEAIIKACNLSAHVWARLDDAARQDVAWALRSVYHAGTWMADLEWREGSG